MVVNELQPDLRSLCPERLHELWVDIENRVSRADFQFVTPAPEWAYKEGKAGTHLFSIQASVPDQSLDLKCALIFSDKVQIINLMIYPADAARIPVFATEIICFGDIPRVAVIDLQAVDPEGPLRNKIDHCLKPLHAQFQDVLTDGGELPDWAEEHFTPYCIYSRPSTSAEWHPLRKALLIYLDLWLTKFIPERQSLITDAEHLNLYRTHHVINTPGRPYLKKIFGDTWSENYFRNFMYSNN